MKTITEPEIKRSAKELASKVGLKLKKIQIVEDKSAFECLEKTKKSDIKQFFISCDTKLRGKPQAIFPTKTRINLVHKLRKEDKISYKFIHQSVDGRELRVHGEKSLSDEFFLYKVVADDREYVFFSLKKLPLVEQDFDGMALHSATSTEVAKRFSLRGFVNLFFVGKSQPTVRILPMPQLFESVKAFSEETFLDYLFYHEEDGRIYKQPKDYQKLVACVLFSGKRDGYPLHLITIGSAGIGKTMKQESLNFKFSESAGIFEASASRLKGLIPSFKEKPASLGYLLSCNRIALVDELFKMIESSMNDGHGSSTSISNALQQFNPILEHKKRTISSGNDNSFVMNPTAKLLADCNPFSNRFTLPEHLSLIDSTTLSRCLIWAVDGQHYQFVSKEKEGYITSSMDSGNPPNTLKYNVFLSIYDTLNSFLSKIEPKDVHRIFNGATSTLRDERLKPLWKARGLHHTHLIIDGCVKLRCLFSGDKDFKAIEEDYDEAEKLLIRILQTMQSTFGGYQVGF